MANFGGQQVREFIHESQKQGHFRIEREKTNNLHIFAYFPVNYLGRHFGCKMTTFKNHKNAKKKAKKKPKNAQKNANKRGNAADRKVA